MRFVLGLFIFVLVVFLCWMGGDPSDDMLTVRLHPTNFMRGVMNVIRGAKSLIGFGSELAGEFDGYNIVGGVLPYGHGARSEGFGVQDYHNTEMNSREGFSLATSNTPFPLPATDIFDGQTVGSAATNALADSAFRTDTNNRLMSLRMSEPEVLRPTLLLDDHLWGGDYPKRDVIQSNPFVKYAIRNPAELTGYLDSRAL